MDAKRVTAAVKVRIAYERAMRLATNKVEKSRELEEALNRITRSMTSEEYSHYIARIR